MFTFPVKYDCIVVGAGHAGIEASLAVARGGFKTLLLTLTLDTIGKMSCNPAIGGIGKGHIVREIDALGGEMGRAIDATGIQFHMLNKSKGPAVWAPRAQADKLAYQQYMKHICELEKNLDVKQDSVEDIEFKGDKVTGVKTKLDILYEGSHVILTTGTFLKGLIHVGDKNYKGGRSGENAAYGLSDSLTKLGFEVKRFKTGTPPRLHRRSVDFSHLALQLGDEDPAPFSFRTEKIDCAQLPCHIAYTNSKTHEVIKKNLHLSAMYGGMIKGIGPRYCPSIEDKVVKFAHKEKHQLFLEPEGRATEEIYVNGFSTSLPARVQVEAIRTIEGLENAEIVRHGYAIEYDYLPPTQLYHTMESKKLKNLYCAGQINGTTGYEEAAAQGLMAGLNILCRLKGLNPLILNRSEAYIGVLVDDLVTKGTDEPYRMFTSRAEFRLLLRQDNADERLMQYGRALGLIDEKTYEKMSERLRVVCEEIDRLRKTRIEGDTLEDLLKRPAIRYADIVSKGHGNQALSEREIQDIEFVVKYRGYIDRQKMEAERMKKVEGKQIPESIDYLKASGMRFEAREKFNRIKPKSLGQASRIPGITPCDISVLMVHLVKMESKGVSRETKD